MAMKRKLKWTAAVLAVVLLQGFITASLLWPGDRWLWERRGVILTFIDRLPDWLGW
jgi:hypothetical protein